MGLALVVGGTEGIGLALARQLREQGWQVEVSSRSSQHHRLDVSDWESTRRASEALAAEAGVPDLVVNCAGLAHPGRLEELEVERLREMVDVNLMGTIHLSRAWVPHLKRRGGGHLLHVSSLAGLFGLAEYTGYCASKFGVLGFCEALRRELAPHRIAVSVLCPPNTRTPGLERENRTKSARLLAQEEKVQVLDPESVARYTLARLSRRPFLIIPSWDGRMAYRLSRWAPWLLDLLLR